MDNKTEFQGEEKVRDSNLIPGNESVNKKKKRKNRKKLAQPQETVKEEILQTDSFLENDFNLKKKITAEFQKEVIEDQLPLEESNKKRKKRKNRKRKSASSRDTGTNITEHDISDIVTIVIDNVNRQASVESDDKNQQNGVTSMRPENEMLTENGPVTPELSSNGLANFDVIDRRLVSLENEVDQTTFEVVNKPFNKNTISESDELISTATVTSDLVFGHTTVFKNKLINAATVTSEQISKHPETFKNDLFSGEHSVADKDTEPFIESPIFSDCSAPTNEGLVALELTYSAQVTPEVEELETFESDELSLRHPALPSHVETCVEGSATLELEKLTNGDLLTIENEYSELSNELIRATTVTSEQISKHPETFKNDSFYGEHSVANKDTEPFIESPISSDCSEPTNEGLVALELTCSTQITPEVEELETSKSDELSLGYPALPNHVETCIEGSSILEPEILTEGDSLTIENEYGELSNELITATTVISEHSEAFENETRERSVTHKDTESLTESQILSDCSQSADDGLVALELTCSAQVTPEVEELQTFESDELTLGHPALPCHVETCDVVSVVLELEKLTEGDLLSTEEECSELTSEDPFPLELNEQNKLMEERPVNDKGRHKTDTDILVPDEGLHADHPSFKTVKDMPPIPDILDLDESSTNEEVMPPTPDILVLGESSINEEVIPSTPAFLVPDEPTTIEEDKPSTADILVPNEQSADQEVMPLIPDILALDEPSTTEEVMSSTSDILVPGEIPQLNRISVISLVDVNHSNSTPPAASDIEAQSSGLSSSEKDDRQESLGLFSLFAAFLVFCLVVFCNVFCSLFLIFKKPSTLKQNIVQKVGFGEPHTSSSQT